MKVFKVKEQYGLKEVASYLLKLAVDENVGLFAFQGDLGAGKTTLTQEIGSMLGIDQTIQSPTYILMNEYPIPKHSKFKTLTHIDVYRLEDIQDSEVFELPNLLSDTQNLTIIEWADKIQSLLPQKYIQVKIDIQDDIREITVTLNKND